MELFIFLLVVLAVAFAIAKVVFNREVQKERSKDQSKRRVRTSAFREPKYVPPEDVGTEQDKKPKTEYSWPDFHEEPEGPAGRKVKRHDFHCALQLKSQIPEDPSSDFSYPNEVLHEGTFRVPNESCVIGVAFSAGLTLESPLVYLEAHGQFVPCGEVVPKIGDGYQGALDFGGFWVTCTTINPDELPPSRIWTQIDKSVRKGSAWEYDIVEFLKGFRRIVETSEGIDETKARLLDYSNSSSQVKAVWKEYEAFHEGKFPDHFLTICLMRKLETSYKHTAALFDAGFTSLEKFEGVTEKDLVALKGIGAVTAKRILARVSELSDF